MSTRTSVLDFVKMTKKKLALCAAFPLAALLVLLFGFVCDEMVGLGGNPVTHAMYSAANYLYCFIFLPLTFVDSDFSSSAIFKTALVLTPVWWYLLACALALVIGRARRG